MADPTVNEELLDRAIRHAIFLERLKTQEVNNILTEFNNDISPKLVAKIERGLEKGFTKKKLRTLEGEYLALSKAGFRNLADSLVKDLKEIGINEAEFNANLLSKTTPTSIVIDTAPNLELIRQLVENTPIRGKLVSRWFDEMGFQTASRVSQQINIGVAQGEEIEQIVRRVKGTRAARFRDGILETSRRNVRTLVRTSVNDITSKAREHTYRQNTDVVKGVMFVATLDARTTDICGSLDRRVFDIGDGPRPPMHMNCRSTTSPVLKSWKELGIDLDEAPPGTRASLNGQVPDDISYPQWLKKQSIEVQNEALGRGKAQIFREGKVKFDRFVDSKNRPLTLNELKRIEKQFD